MYKDEYNMSRENTGRIYFIDFIKFVFAIVIAIFHTGTGILGGGRIAVEGFFMISGYLMMRSLQQAKTREEDIGISTVRFLSRKYISVIGYVIPSVIVSVIVKTVSGQTPVTYTKQNAPLLFFAFVLGRDFGFQGWYVNYIDWYLSAMMFALAVLYPLVYKYKNFVKLTAVPTCMVVYGYMSFEYGSIAAHTGLAGNGIIQVGIIRGLAGCLAGCLLYECVQKTSTLGLNNKGRFMVFVLEVLGYYWFFNIIALHPKSNYDYIAVFLIFGLLLVGISGISCVSSLFKHRWLGHLGVCSTLIALNHSYWNESL